MLVSAKEMLNKALEGKYAVGQFNINNLEWTKAILLTAQECNSPVILGVSEGAGKYMCGYKTVVGMVKGMIEELNITVPVALHLDHGTFEGAKACINAGFSSIMFDGSHYPIAENIEKTTALVNTCDILGISLEAEVGSIGGEEDGVIGMGECADPNECKAIADLGVTMLAAGIGNIHGKYPANWPGLSFETLAAVKEKVGNMPLVLHGGTGTPRKLFHSAFPRSMLTQSANLHSRKQQESTSKKARIFRVRASIPESSSHPALRLSRLQLRKRWNSSDQSTRLDRSFKEFIPLFYNGGIFLHTAFDSIAVFLLLF